MSAPSLHNVQFFAFITISQFPNSKYTSNFNFQITKEIDLFVMNFSALGHWNLLESGEWEIVLNPFGGFQNAVVLKRPIPVSQPVKGRVLALIDGGCHFPNEAKTIVDEAAT